MIDTARANELFRIFRTTGDLKVRNELVENYLYVAEILAKKFAGRGVEYDDLYQVASEALIMGVEKFDPDVGVQFTTYITPTVTGVIKNYFRDFSRAVRPPRKIYTLSARVKSETDAFFTEHGAMPTIKQLAARLDASEESIIEALEYRAPISLDSKVGDDDGDSRLYDIIPDSHDNFESFDDGESLRSEIEKLDPTEQKVIKLRFVHGKSQSEVGRILGVSQMFVSRAEKKIVEKLRKSLL